MSNSLRVDKAPPTARVCDVIANFQPTRRFAPSPHEKPYYITSLDFDDTGELCLVARDDETLQIYNCKEGKHAKELKSQKYGADLARFAHHPQSIIYASTRGDDSIRYLSSHDNTYIRYFRGHTAAVTSLCLSPSSDTFVSTALDNTIRLWDLRSQCPQAQLNLVAPSLAVYDPTATVLAIACLPAQSIMLYDVRNYDKAPFATFEMREIENTYGKRHNTSTTAPGAGVLSNWAKLEFSNDGKRLLVATTGSGHYVLDAFEGQLEFYLARPMGPTGRVSPSGLDDLRKSQQAGNTGRGASGQGDACFSPDGRYVISGSGEVGLYAWDLEQDGRNVAESNERMLRPTMELSGGKVTSVTGASCVVGYNSRHNLLCTADRALVFWVPVMD